MDGEIYYRVLNSVDSGLLNFPYEKIMHCHRYSGFPK